MKTTSNNHEEELKNAERIAYLIAGHINNTLSTKEADELDDWISASDENLELFEKLTDEDNIEEGMQKYLLIEKEKAAAFARVKEGAGLLPGRKSVMKLLAPYLVAAAFVIIAASIYLLKTASLTKKSEKPLVQDKTEDIAPGTDKAVLTLSDGRTIILDGANIGLITDEDGVKVTKLHGGELSYHSSGAARLAFHTLSVPRGGRYTLQLPDGSTVWLNAESTLRYPISFSNQTRDVELRGEAYFEIAKKENIPFTVKITGSEGDGGMVKVLGTHFNINGYGDEGLIITTLLEGSVLVEKNGLSKILKPGEQALSAKNIAVVKTDVNEAIAWKNGRFLFRNATIKSIGEQIKRWYDVEVVYGGNIPQHFNTEMSRNLPLSKLLDGLEGTMQVHFSLDGRKLTIKP